MQNRERREIEAGATVNAENFEKLTPPVYASEPSVGQLYTEIQNIYINNLNLLNMIDFNVLAQLLLNADRLTLTTKVCASIKTAVKSFLPHVPIKRKETKCQK